MKIDFRAKEGSNREEDIKWKTENVPEIKTLSLLNY